MNKKPYFNRKPLNDIDRVKVNPNVLQLLG